ncbi:MAG TPA: TolC family protein [Gemmatimonadales bacterium]|jgi:outer membrane protein TolC
MITLSLLVLAALQAPTQRDPLGPLVAEALRNNLGLEAERLAERRAAADVSAARGLFFPSVTLDSRYTHEEGALDFGDLLNPAFAALNQIRGTNDFPTNLELTLPLAHDSRVRLTQPLFNETIRQNYALARNRRTGQELARRGAARRLAAQVQLAYLSLAAARNVAAIYESSALLVTENERVAQRLVAAGRGTPDAVFRARAERSDVEQRLAEAREQVDAASRAVNQLLRRPLDAPVEQIPDSALTFEITASADEAVARALAQREELGQLDAGARTADAAAGIATAAFLPTVSVAVDYGFQGQDVSFDRQHDYWMASLVVSWNLFNGGQDAARRSAAHADAQRLRISRQDTEDKIRLEVRQAYEAAVVARDAIATAEARVAAARRTFDLVRRRYEEGEANQIAFLDARTQLTNAELNRALTANRYAMRYVDLERAAALRSLD